MSANCIRIWQYHKAPEEFKSIIPETGHEWCLMHVPVEFSLMTLVYGLAEDPDFAPTGVSVSIHMHDKSKIFISYFRGV